MIVRGASSNFPEIPLILPEKIRFCGSNPIGISFAIIKGMSYYCSHRQRY